ncbi:MAG: YlbF family regulator [Victivallales bacterium]|nr:YlbF family regulator [Victivallales bacterium]
MSKKSIFHDNQRLYELLRDFCDGLAEEQRFREAQCCINEFLSGEQARTHYEALLDLEDELHLKQHDGELTEADLERYHHLNETLRALPDAERFFLAQEELEEISSQIVDFIGLAIETGQVPTPEELETLEHTGACDDEHCAVCHSDSESDS